MMKSRVIAKWQEIKIKTVGPRRNRMDCIEEKLRKTDV